MIASLLEQILKLANRIWDLFTPTPREEAQERIGDVHEAVGKAKDSRGDMSDLDSLLK